MEDRGISATECADNKRPLRIVLGAAVVLLSLAFLGYFVYRNRTALTAYQWQPNYGQLALSLVLHLLAFVAAIVAWHLMMRRMAEADNWRHNLRIYCFGALAKRLPGVAWDIATRAVMYDQMGVSKAVVALASVVELVLVFVAGIVSYIALRPFSSSAALGTLPLLAALALGAILTHPRVLAWAVRRVKREAQVVHLRYRDTLAWLFLYVWTWLFSGAMLFVIIRSLFDLPLGHLPQILADWTLAGLATSLLTFLPTNLGLQEVTLTLLLARYVPEPVALVAVILMRGLTIVYSVLWVLLSTRL